MSATVSVPFNGVRPDWHARARCRGDLGWFDIPTTRGVNARALDTIIGDRQNVCAGCTERTNCAQLAVDEGIGAEGVYAGIFIPSKVGRGEAMRTLERIAGRSRLTNRAPCGTDQGYRQRTQEAS